MLPFTFERLHVFLYALPASLLNNSVPSLSNNAKSLNTLRASCSSFQGISPNWQQRRLSVLCLWCVRACSCRAGWHHAWQEPVWEDLPLKARMAVLAICFPGNRCISETTAGWKKIIRGSKMPPELRTRYYLQDWMTHSRRKYEASEQNGERRLKRRNSAQKPTRFGFSKQNTSV